MFLFVAVLAIACAAVARPTFVGTSIVFSSTILVLGLSIVFAVASSQRQRVFWISFALLGWGYLIITLAPFFAQNIGASVVTTLLLRCVAEGVGVKYLDPDGYGGGGGLWGLFRMQYDPTLLWDDLLISGHSMLSLLAGWLGGCVGSIWFARRRHGENQP
jgi:hypothetical protein